MSRQASLLMYLLIALAMSNPLVAAEVQQPKRSIGYFIGDILIQRIYLESHEGRINNTDLQAAERVDEYLYRLPVVQSSDNSGIGNFFLKMLRSVIALYHALYHTLSGGTMNGGTPVEIRYQVTNAPSATRTISLPEMTLTTDTGATIVVAAWPFNIGPLSSEAGYEQPVSGDPQNESLKLLPDRSASELLGCKGSTRIGSETGIVACTVNRDTTLVVNVVAIQKIQGQTRTTLCEGKIHYKEDTSAIRRHGLAHTPQCV